MVLRTPGHVVPRLGAQTRTPTCQGIAVITVPYIIVNIYNYSRPIVSVTNNLTGLSFFRVGRRDLGMRFGD